MDLERFEKQLASWCSHEDGIVAAAVIGSHARGEAQPDSDIDVIILTSAPGHLLRDCSWLSSFGRVSTPIPEDWGAITSLRTHYQTGPEIEFGIGSPSWAHLPPDSGTRRVVTGGIRITYDPSQILRELVDCVQQST